MDAPYELAEEVERGIARVLAHNPSAFTYRGTQTYLAGKTEIAVIEPTGSETQVVARLAGQRIVGVFRERISAKPGEILAIEPNLSSVHLFDAASGQRLQ